MANEDDKIKQKGEELSKDKNKIQDKANQHVFELYKEGVLKRVETENEFWTEFKKYKKKINKLMRKSYKFFGEPKEFIEQFENILAEMVFVGVVTEEWAQGQRERLYRELNKPEEFKDWVDEGKKKIKEKFRRNQNGKRNRR